MHGEPQRRAARLQRCHQLVGDARGIDDRHAAMDADHADMVDGVERRDQLGQPPRRQHQRIAAGQDHFPDLRPRLDVGDGGVELVGRQRLAARPDLLAAEAEAAIDRADMQRLQQHAVGIAMHDALDRRARLVADRVGQLLGRDLGLGDARHELARDRIGRIGAVDQPQHLGRDGDRHRLGGLRQPRIGRDEPLAFQGLQGAQGLHGGVKYPETSLSTSSENHHHPGRSVAGERGGV